jgi:rhodanese-related sulfurtransferase
VALQLKRLGIDRVRPLQGGLEEWIDLGFPTVELEVLVDSD